MEPTVYRGSIDRNKNPVVTKDGLPFLHLESQKVMDHSPDGFNWGYGGSGPAQLALALLLDHGLSAEEAVRLHQPYKREVVGAFPHHEGPCWEVSSADIQNWIDAHQPPKEELPAEPEDLDDDEMEVEGEGIGFPAEPPPPPSRRGKR